jgi:L-alanine-DL-glutamate epimerase-like enolase superfamily enzyme
MKVVLMKIADVKTTWLSIPLKSPLADSTHVLDKIEWILVDVVTDTGLTGSAHMLNFDYAPELLKGIVDTELKEQVVGQNPLLIEKVREVGLRQTEYIGHCGVAAWGVAAIDIALWDILGKHLHCPVAFLLGAYRDSVPIYGSGGWLSYSMDQLLEEVTSYARRGFKGVKMTVGSGNMKQDVQRVKAVRKAIGGDLMLMVDANQGWNTHQARQFYRQIRDCNIFWFEEPIPKDDWDGYSKLASAIDVPLATGEREYSLTNFREILKRQAAAVIQPDALRIGGITQWMKLARLCEAFGVRVASHFYKEIDVHCLAACPNGAFLEYFPWLDELLVEPLEISGGVAKVPARPGLGIEIKPEAIQEFRVD